jgi:hypothetical protein
VEVNEKIPMLMVEMVNVSRFDVTFVVEGEISAGGTARDTAPPMLTEK